MITTINILSELPENKQQLEAFETMLQDELRGLTGAEAVQAYHSTITNIRAVLKVLEANVAEAIIASAGRKEERAKDKVVTPPEAPLKSRKKTYIKGGTIDRLGAYYGNQNHKKN